MRNRRLFTAFYAAMALLFHPAVGSADAVTDWNAIMVTTLTGQNPFAQARFAAITQLAVFEAVNAITGDFRPYLGTIKAPSSASPEAATIAAAHAVLKNYFPGNSAVLDAARESSLAAIPDGAAKNSGIAAGEAAAAAMIAARADDGAGTPKFYMPSSSDPGEWQTTPGCPAGGGVFLHWPEVTPFGIKSAGQFRLDPPPSLTSTGYTRDYAEARVTGSIDSMDRPQDRTDVARIYAAVSPVQVFNPIARSAAEGKSLSETARALALLNMAISDAAVATFDTKYTYKRWRPETAIRAGDMDGNPRTEADPAFVPLITAPCFPSYPSAHATLSNAAREVIERIFGAGPQPSAVSSAGVPGVTLEYDKLKQVTADIDDARVYGGIHFRFDQDAGAEQGRRIGEYVSKNSLKPAKGCGCDEQD